MPMGLDDLDPRALAAAMVDAVGAKLTAAACGVPRAVTVAAWADGAAPPAVTELVRLRGLYLVWQLVAEAEGADVAKAWLISTNILLGGDAPIAALREGSVDEVIAAARAHVENRPAT